jgi:hypothetical protein
MGAETAAAWAETRGTSRALTSLCLNRLYCSSDVITDPLVIHDTLMLGNFPVALLTPNAHKNTNTNAGLSLAYSCLGLSGTFIQLNSGCCTVIVTCTCTWILCATYPITVLKGI